MNRFCMRTTTVSTLIMASVTLLASGCSDSGSPAVVSTGTSSGSQSGSSSGSGSGSSGSVASGSASGNTSGSVTSGSSSAGVFTSGSFTSGTSSGTSSGGTGTSSGASSQTDAAADAPAEAAGGDGGSGEAGSDASKGDGGGFPDCSNAPVATWKADIYPKIIQPWCGMKCHNANDATGGGLDLFPADQARAWSNLVRQPVKNGYPCTGHYQWRVTCPRAGTIPACAANSNATPSCACSGPGDPETSEVYMKLTGHQLCGNAEPQGTPAGVLYPKTMPFMPLPNDQICMWYTWIKAGAMDN